jgi:hypothetical protein
MMSIDIRAGWPNAWDRGSNDSCLPRRGVDGVSEFTLTGMEEISVSMCWREHEDSERRDNFAFLYAILGESLAGNTYLIRIAHDP